MANKLTRANFDAIRDHLFDRIHKNGEQLKNDFPNTLRLAIKNEVWREFANAEGKPFDNLVDWLHFTFPSGVSMGQGQHAITYEEALVLTEGSKDVHRVLAENAPNRGRGGDRRSAKAKENQSVPTHFERQGKRSKPVLSARLAQEHPKHYDRYLKGEYKTVTAAAIAAGILKNDANMRRAKSAYRNMTTEERKEFLEWVKSVGVK